jgi:hypothetical protein
MTEPSFDSDGNEHNYCYHCLEEIYNTLESYDEEDDDWPFWDSDDLDYLDSEESFIEDQEVTTVEDS